MSVFNVRAANLRAINSMTKYPSIPTYHALDPKTGSLQDAAVPFTGPVIGTEKVDGTNARIILLPDRSYLLGSREELLYAKSDLIGNPSQGIVDALKTLAETVHVASAAVDVVRVLYLEVYGGKIGAQAKQYSSTGAVGWRLFDVVLIDGVEEKQSWSAEQIAGWRDSGGQVFADEDHLRRVAAMAGVQLTPRLFTIDAAALPTELAQTQAFLSQYLPTTLVSLDKEPGQAEGIVLRTPDRSLIAKARFQDYVRTLRRKDKTRG